MNICVIRHGRVFQAIIVLPGCIGGGSNLNRQAGNNLVQLLSRVFCRRHITYVVIESAEESVGLLEKAFPARALIMIKDFLTSNVVVAELCGQQWDGNDVEIVNEAGRKNGVLLSQLLVLIIERISFT